MDVAECEDIGDGRGTSGFCPGTDQTGLVGEIRQKGKPCGNNLSIFVVDSGGGTKVQGSNHPKI